MLADWEARGLVEPTEKLNYPHSGEESKKWSDEKEIQNNLAEAFSN